MTPNNSVTVLPFYNNVELQNHRRFYAFGEIYPLIMPADTLLPFQIIRPTRASQVQAVSLINKDGVQIMDLADEMIDAGLQIIRFETLGYDVIVWPGNENLNVEIDEGIYYLAIDDGSTFFFSDMFKIVKNVSGCFKIEWGDVDDLVFEGGRIVYANPQYRNVLYLPDTELAKPEYDFTENGDNRDGYFFPEKQISEKTYRFNFIAPEYLCDATRLIRLSDYIKVTSLGQEYICDTFDSTVSWQVQGNLASVDSEFQTMSPIKKIGRGYTPST